MAYLEEMSRMGIDAIKDKEQMRKVLSNIDAFIEAAREYGTYPLSSAI